MEGFIARGELRRVAIDTASTEGPVGMTVRRGARLGEGARLLVEAIRRIVGRRAAAGLVSNRVRRRPPNQEKTR